MEKSWQLSCSKNLNEGQFLNEIVFFTSVKHKNLVTLKGCFLHGVQHLLVYEFVENQNLIEVSWGMVTF
jgi:serine/threonine protein kinase